MQALVQEREKTPRLACRALRLVRWRHLVHNGV